MQPITPKKAGFTKGLNSLSMTALMFEKDKYFPWYHTYDLGDVTPGFHEILFCIQQYNLFMNNPTTDNLI